MHQAKARELLHAIFADHQSASEQSNPPRCHDNQAEIYAYIDAELNGENAAKGFPQLHEQIRSCESCRIAYEEVRELLNMERLSMFTEPPTEVTFDIAHILKYSSPHQPVLSALERIQLAGRALVEQTKHAVHWGIHEAGQMVVSLSTEFIDSLQIQEEPVHLKSAGSDLFAVTSPDISTDLRVTLTARKMQLQPDQCTLAVTVEIPSRGGWPNLGNIEVSLQIGEGTAETMYTDTFGKAAFSGVKKDDLGAVTVIVNPL